MTPMGVRISRPHPAVSVGSGRVLPRVGCGTAVQPHPRHASLGRLRRLGRTEPVLDLPVAPLTASSPQRRRGVSPALTPIHVSGPISSTNKNRSSLGRAVCCASPAIVATSRVFSFHLGPGAMVNICPGPTGGLDAPAGCRGYASRCHTSTDAYHRPVDLNYVSYRSPPSTSRLRRGQETLVPESRNQRARPC